MNYRIRSRKLYSILSLLIAKVGYDTAIKNPGYANAAPAADPVKRRKRYLRPTINYHIKLHIFCSIKVSQSVMLHRYTYVRLKQINYCRRHVEYTALFK